MVCLVSLIFFYETRDYILITCIKDLIAKWSGGNKKSNYNRYGEIDDKFIGSLKGVC